MNLDHLKVFYVAAMKRNFSETAKALHLSQPTVSLQIQQLESVLEVKLFERTTKQIKLTDSGKLLYQYAEQILHLVNKSKKELALLTESVRGDLNVGASLTIGEYILPYLIGNYHREYPKVSLFMKLYNSTQIIHQLQNEEIDLGFIEAPISHPKLVHLPFMEDELILISSVKNPHPMIGNREMVAVDEIFHLPLVLREPESGTRQVMEESLRKHHLDPDKLNVILELTSTESIKATVESGMALSMIFQSAIQKELQLGTLRKLHIQGLSLRRNFYAIYDKNRVHSVQAETFLNHVLEQHHQPVFSNLFQDKMGELG